MCYGYQSSPVAGRTVQRGAKRPFGLAIQPIEGFVTRNDGRVVDERAQEQYFAKLAIGHF